MKYLVLAGFCCVFLSLQIGVLAQDVSSAISKSQFDEILKHRNDAACSAKGFYTYEAFINAARSFNGFSTTGDTNTRKREIAAFLAQTSQITRGWSEKAKDNPYAWGYCKLIEGGNHPPSYCVSNQQWPCAPGKSYYGRGPIQIVGNNNYGPIGKAIGVDLLANPDLVQTDPVIAFKTAIWFWMTPQSQKPSSHDVITGRWVQSSRDKAANRVPGFGVVTNIFNGNVECGKGSNDQMQDKIEFFKRYSNILGVSPGNNLDGLRQTAPF